MLPIYSIHGNEKGIVFPVALAFLAILGLLGTTAVVTTTTDMKIGGNYKAGEQAFYIAQAGIEEARARLKADAGTGVLINDGHPTQPQWTAYIGSDVKVKGKGYDSSNTMHYKTPSKSDLDYTVQIAHQTDTGSPPTGNVLYWGDTDGDGDYERTISTDPDYQNIYLITSYGCAGSSEKTVEVEIARLPPVTAPAALYGEAPTDVKGSSTHIIGWDACGSDHRPGITLASGSVTEIGNPTITGSPSDIVYNAEDMDVQSMVDSLVEYADFSYVVDTETHTASTTPGPGEGWGTPTQGADQDDPSSCGVSNVVHYDTNGTSIKLSGGVSGCGILIVKGDLVAHGGFSWHGVILVTGTVTFSGGGQKNITGAVIAGNELDAEVDDEIGGNTTIVYCSSAINSQTQNQPLRTLTWKEEM